MDTLTQTTMGIIAKAERIGGIVIDPNGSSPIEAFKKGGFKGYVTESVKDGDRFGILLNNGEMYRFLNGAWELDR